MSIESRSKSGIRRRRWTAKEFYQLLDLGFFDGQRVQLIDGVILQMAAQKNYHALGIKLTEDALNAAFGANYWVRVQMSLDLRPYSVPDPDLAVIPGAPRTHDPSTNPNSALLIVEVSDSTLRFDRGRKLSLYARAGIADYWILNLVDRQLEVYRNPVPKPKKRLRFDYGSSTILSSTTDTISPLAAPAARIAVGDMLP